MTCAWNRRRVSRALGLLIGLALAGTVATAAPVLRCAPGVRVTPELTGWLLEDRVWLRDLPAADLALSAEPSAGGDDLETLRAALGAMTPPAPKAAAAAPATTRRPVTSRLRDRWQARGHLACAVSRRDSAGVAILELAPGSLYTVGRVELEGPPFRGRDRVMARILPQTGTPFRAETWRRAVAALVVAAGEDGYPFARWLVRDVSVDPRREAVDLHAVLMTGPAQTIGPQSSSLPGGRGEEFLVRAARLPAGRPYSESRLRAARTRLQQRDIYAEVGEPVIYTTDAPDTVGVYWPVTLTPRPNRAAMVLGLSRAAADEPARLSGQVDLRLANLAGSGRRLDVAWSDDGRDRSHFGLAWLEPLVRGTPFDAVLEVDQETARDVYSRFRLDGRVQLPVAGPWQVEMGLGWDRSTYPVGDWTRSTRWRARGAFQKRRLDRAASDWWGIFAVESARRSVDARPESNLDVVGDTPAEVRQTMVDLRLAGERWLGRTLSVAVTGVFREVTGDGGPAPLSEQYRLGGARSLRGYLEDQFHGERVASTMLELRVGRPGRSRLYTFFDVGYFRFAGADPIDPARLIDTDGTRRGFGLGLETHTAGGDVSLAIGLPGTVQFDDAKLHITLLQTF